MNEADGTPGEELLSRFFEEFPDGGRDEYDAWAAALRPAPSEEHVAEARELLEAWLPAAERLAAAPGESLHGFGRAAGREARPAPSIAGTPHASGDRVGDFVLRRFIARGGMGQVWEAEDTRLRRRVALKFLRTDRVDEQSLRYFLREARAGGRSAHPNLVATLGHDSDGERTWIVQELVEGSWTLKDTLGAVRAEERVPEGYHRRVARIVAGVADGMQAAHEAGVIHRDLKPQNVLLTREDVPKVTDFGLARVADDSFLSISGEVAGTWAYMSPEQVQGRSGAIDHRSDVFSLGGILYELLTLRRPFEGDTTQQVARRITLEDPPLASSVRTSCPRDLALIAAKALEKNPERRYASMADLAADLRAWLEHRPIAARAPSLVERAFKLARRRPALVSAGAIAAIAFLLVSGLSFRLFQQAGDLRVQTALAEDSAETNAELARVANQRADEVLTLSTTRQIAELESSARRLWPAGPELVDEYETWLARARALVEGRPADEGEGERGIPPLAEQVARLEALNERARPLEDPERAAVADEAAARRPALQARLERTRARRDWMRAMLARGPFPEQDASGPSVSARRALVLALELLGPRGFDPARRTRGRRLAEQAFETVDAEARPLAAIAMGWAELREGNPDDARTCLEMAREGAPDGGIEIGLDAAELERELERWSHAARDQREAELAGLERAVVTLEVILGLRVLEDHESAWWHEQLAELVRRIEELHDPDAGLAGRAVAPAFGWGVARRLDWARQLEARARDPRLAARWRDARDAIAADPRYGGLRMRRIPGLEPLGVDPDSGLHEFAHVASGEAPRRGADGRLRIGESTGIVLVLLPGGRFWMGAQATDPDGRNYDAMAQGGEGPPHEVQLSPFLLSKYELTQAQWLRMNGDEPSQAGPGVSYVEGRLHPVEWVSWDEADECLRRFDLELPSEARWEYAVRAGSDTPWVWGEAHHPSGPLVNIADLAAKEAGAGAGWPPAAAVQTYRDGYVLHAPVGSFPPNAFGLHEMIGNVREWVLDSFSEAFYANGPTMDPVCTADTASLLDPASRIFRGASCSDDPVPARTAARSSLNRAGRHYHHGVRPARSVPRND